MERIAVCALKEGRFQTILPIIAKLKNVDYLRSTLDNLLILDLILKNTFHNDNSKHQNLNTFHNRAIYKRYLTAWCWWHIGSFMMVYGGLYEVFFSAGCRYAGRRKPH